ncbi:DNA topoisomerase, partial [Staphylococcus pasteuri]|uniref:DNA topoisomerase n=1 Tax=Staphylococcus pasteuri TaxID=45972 RepID=UPI0021C1E689
MFNHQNLSHHHPIIPTQITPHFSQLTNTQTKIYILILQTFLQTLIPPYQYQTIKVYLALNGYQFLLQEKL